MYGMLTKNERIVSHCFLLSMNDYCMKTYQFVSHVSELAFLYNCFYTLDIISFFMSFTYNEFLPLTLSRFPCL
jgi:hypothetical protein